MDIAFQFDLYLSQTNLSSRHPKQILQESLLTFAMLFYQSFLQMECLQSFYFISFHLYIIEKWLSKVLVSEFISSEKQ